MSGATSTVILPAREVASIEAAAEALRGGGIVGLPTETVYGIAVLPHAQFLQALVSTKRRSAEKGIALLVDSISQVEALAAVPILARTLADRFWPGPLTLVLAPLEGVALPELLYGPSGALGFRSPDHATPRTLAAQLGPIALTSANISGEPDALTVEDLLAAMGDAIALVLDGGRTAGGTPSTVVALDDEHDEPTILREGAIDRPTIMAALGKD